MVALGIVVDSLGTEYWFNENIRLQLWAKLDARWYRQ